MMDKQRKKLLPCAADHRLDEPAKLSLSMVASPQCPLPFLPPERVYSAKLLGSKTEIPVYAVNSNGKPKWEFRPGGDIRWLTFGPAGRVYISALVNMNFVADAPHDTAPPFRSQLYALRADGTQVWNSGTLGSP